MFEPLKFYCTFCLSRPMYSYQPTFSVACHAIKATPRETLQILEPGRVAQSVGHLTRKSGVLGSISGLATSFRFSFRFFSYWRKYVLEVLVNRLGGLSLPRKSVVRLTDLPDMTLDVYRGRKTTMQQQQQQFKYWSSLTMLYFRAWRIE